VDACSTWWSSPHRVGVLKGIPELHPVLQAAFGCADAHRVALTDLGLRATERFAYHDDVTAGWRPDLRVEQSVAAQLGQRTRAAPAGAGPPEGCGGPWAFLEQTQPHRVYEATLRAAEILGQLLDNKLTTFGVDREELAGLLPLLGLERFDRRAMRPRHRERQDLASLNGFSGTATSSPPCTPSRTSSASSTPTSREETTLDRTDWSRRRASSPPTSGPTPPDAPIFSYISDVPRIV